MKDLINNLADHLGLNLAYRLQDDSDVCVYRMIDGWGYHYWIHAVAADRYLEQWLQLASDHMDAVEKFDAAL